MEQKTYTIDAADKGPGRLANQIAILLQGKHKADFVRYKEMGDVVIVKNVGKMKFTGKKLEQEKYRHHTGYMGGLKEKSLREVFKEKPEEVLRRAVYGMLPKNRLRDKMIKKLQFE